MPFTVVCRYCRQNLTLYEDRQAALQQVRAHILNHMWCVKHHISTVERLLDMLCFKCPEDPVGWRGEIDRLLNDYEEKGVM